MEATETATESGIWDWFAWVHDFWSYELVRIDSNPVTLGKVIVGILLFIIGYFLCKNLSREFSNRVLTKFDIEDSLRHTLQTVSFYIMLVILTLFVLRLLNVPITIFTVIGGALAIGVGFGSQNIVNNFISGLVMMVERPVKVGDIIQQGDLVGRVEHIGARSTIIRSIENTHTVVPNSTFLEKNVLNWTLSDNLVRQKVRVGVAYGSDTLQVKEKLLEAAMSLKDVLKYPEPHVVFADFGDSALVFDIYYWVRIKDRIFLINLQSDMRFKIDELFRESNLVIAFPQSDVHLDTQKPLQIELTQR